MTRELTLRGPSCSGRVVSLTGALPSQQQRRSWFGQGSAVDISPSTCSKSEHYGSLSFEVAVSAVYKWGRAVASRANTCTEELSIDLFLFNENHTLTQTFWKKKYK